MRPLPPVPVEPDLQSTRDDADGAIGIGHVMASAEAVHGAWVAERPSLRAAERRDGATRSWTVVSRLTEVELYRRQSHAEHDLGQVGGELRENPTER